MSKESSKNSFRLTDKAVAVIEEKIGYVFKDKALLNRAFTHSSAAHEATVNYECLEFLGDSILDFIVAKRIMLENPNAHEGTLTHRRAEIVSQEPLDEAIGALDIAKYLIVGKGESVNSIISNTKVKSNLFESIVGAIYLDSRDVNFCENFIVKALKSQFDGSAKHKTESDFKTALNEYATKHKFQIKYVTVEKSGEPHQPTFVVEVHVDGEPVGKGVGKSKKAAEQNAAEVALEHFAIRCDK